MRQEYTIAGGLKPQRNVGIFFAWTGALPELPGRRGAAGKPLQARGSACGKLATDTVGRPLPGPADGGVFR
jgi:hypothetical protein